MIDYTNYTEEDEMNVCEELRTTYNLETYEDFALMLKKIALVTDFLLTYNEAPMEDVEQSNLSRLRELLPVCSQMMIDCDEYYRD